MLLLTVLKPAVASGLSDNAAASILFITLGSYAIWMHWFLARHGLALSVGRAALLVVTVNIVTVMLLFGPLLLTGLS
jgi:hypothetical protein